MLGVIVGLPIEARNFARKLKNIQQTYQLDSQTLLRISGIGEENASIAAQALVEAGAKSLISFGTAVGLASNVMPGTLCLPKKIINPSNQNTLTVDSFWHSTLLNLCTNRVLISCGDLLHSQQILHANSQKILLYQQFKTVAADMETFAVASVAQQFNYPFLAVRIILDPANFNMPNFLTEIITQEGRILPISLLKHLIKEPRTITILMRLSYYFARAKTTMKIVTHSKVLQQSFLQLKNQNH